VTGLIILTNVGFGLDDAPDETPAVLNPHQPLPQQLAGDGECIACKEVAFQT
jgi:hypothetical protein